MKIAVWVIRLLLGATFMVSGGAKMIDPLGTLTKIEAYLASWGWDWPREMALVGGCGLAMLEFITGFLLATGSLRRASSWIAAAIMAFMLPLTAYVAIANPVDDCGCFGDFIILSNTATFLKNIVLTAMAVFLVRYNRRARCLFAPWSQWIQITVAAAYMLFVGIVGYHEQPLIDFRPYPVGEPIVDNQGAEVRYVYRDAQGNEHEFADDELPDEELGWEYVYVSEVAPASGKMLSLFDRESGMEVTDSVLGATSDQMLLLLPEPSAATAAGSYTANELCTEMERRYGPGSFIGLTDANPEAVDAALDLMMADYPVYYADPKAIKTVARGNMAVVYLRNDTVCWKRTLSSINLDLIDGNSDVDLATVYDTDGPRLFGRLTAVFLALEAALALLSNLPLLLRLLRFRRLRRNKAAEPQAEKKIESA